MPTDIHVKHDKPIFISYARKDGTDLALELRDELLRLKFNIWHDVVSMPMGQKWRHALAFGIPPPCPQLSS